MKISKRKLKQIIREEYSRLKKKQINESYFKNLLIEIEDFIVDVASSYAGSVPRLRLAKLLQREFDYFRSMSIDEIDAELDSLAGMMSDGIEVDRDSVNIYKLSY